MSYVQDVVRTAKYSQQGWKLRGTRLVFSRQGLPSACALLSGDMPARRWSI